MPKLTGYEFSTAMTWKHIKVGSADHRRSEPAFLCVTTRTDDGRAWQELAWLSVEGGLDDLAKPQLHIAAERR